MKKSVVILLLALVAIIIFSPAIVGKIAERSVDENLNWAATESGEFAVTALNFDHGWFSSEGQHRIELREGSTRDLMLTIDDEVPVFVIDTRLDHGLIPVSSMGRDGGSMVPGLGSAVSTLSLEYSNGELIEVPGTIYTEVGLTGNVDSTYVLEAGSREAEGAAITWQPSSVNVVINPSSGRINAKGDVGPLTIVDEEVTATVDGMTFSADQAATRYGFSTGSIEASLGQVALKSDVIESIVFRGMNVVANTALDDDKVNSDIKAEYHGPEVPGVGEVSVFFDAKIDNVDAAAVGAISAKLRNASPSSDPTTIMMSAEKELMDLVAAGFELDIEQLDVALPMGTLVTSMTLMVPESDRDTFRWTSLLQSPEAELDISVPDELMQFIMMMNPEASMVVGMGYLKKDGDDYVMDADLKKGLLTINGAPIPIPFGAFQ